MSGVEILNYLKKSLGVITKILEKKGALVSVTATEHLFLPFTEVSDAGAELDVSGFLYEIRNVGDYPVYYNLDRPVTDFEYDVVFPGSIKIVGRVASKLYLKAPEGFKTRVKVNVLRVGG